MAYRLARGTVLNTSYSITYNTSSYSSIAQRLVAQPPFADTLTNAGSLDDPLSLETGLLGGAGVTTNNFGIDPRLRSRHDPDVERDCHDARSGESGRRRRAIPARAARASTCFARRIATPTARSASTACSPSSGSRRVDARCCRWAASPSSAAWPRGLQIRRQLHAGQVQGQRVVAWRRRRGRGAERPGSRRRIRVVELRPAAPVQRQRQVGAAVRRRAGGGWPNGGIARGSGRRVGR